MPLFNFSAILSANARTLEADILHLEKKATKSTTRKQLLGKF